MGDQMLSQPDSTEPLPLATPESAYFNVSAAEPPSPTSSSDFFFSASVTAASSSSDEIRNPSPSPSPDPSQNPPQIPITWPSGGTLTLDWVTNLMSTFDWSSRNLRPSDFPTVLPVEAFDALVLTASKILHKEPNCVPIEPDKDGVVGSSVVVVGDVHGQLHDVLFLLKEAGLPSENRFFVFNGDYVDRGAWGLETFLLLLAWKCCKVLGC